MLERQGIGMEKPDQSHSHAGSRSIQMTRLAAYYIKLLAHYDFSETTMSAGSIIFYQSYCTTPVTISVTHTIIHHIIYSES